MSDSENEDLDLSSHDVTTKYQTAGAIVNTVLPQVLAKCVAGADVAEICIFGDQLIEKECSKVYNKKEKNGSTPTKGLAFPTCVSPNAIVGHLSPLAGESMKLEAGDMVKVDLGAHIDGFVACAAHTVVIPGGEPCARKADVLHAAWTAAEAAARAVQAGRTNTYVTEVMNKSAESFKCNMVQGVLSHQMKRHVIAGNKSIIAKETVEDKVEEFEFETNDVYCIDVLVSSGEGRPKETEMRTTVFKRDPEVQVNLRTQKARQFLSEVNRKFSLFPFSLRQIDDPLVAKVGASEAGRHGLVDPHPVVKEKDGDFVAHFKFTALLLGGGTKKACGLPLETDLKSEHEVVDEDLKKLLSRSLNPKKKKSKPKKPAAEKENAAGNADADA